MDRQVQHPSARSRADRITLPSKAINILIVGLGGMGVVGLTRRIGAVLRSHIRPVFTRENRGFAQRRASVTGAIRAGRGVRSPELVTGANLLLALEASEALRYEHMIDPEALVVVCDACIWPTGCAGKEFQPVDAADVTTRLARRGARVLSLPVCAWLKERAFPQVYASSAMLGAFAALGGIEIEHVEDLLRESWSKGDREQNLAVCRWAYAYVSSSAGFGCLAEAA